MKIEKSMLSQSSKYFTEIKTGMSPLQNGWRLLAPRSAMARSVKYGKCSLEAGSSRRTLGTMRIGRSYSLPHAKKGEARGLSRDPSRLDSWSPYKVRAVARATVAWVLYEGLSAHIKHVSSSLPLFGSHSLVFTRPPPSTSIALVPSVQLVCSSRLADGDCRRSRSFMRRAGLGPI